MNTEEIRTSGDRDIGKTAVGRESEVAIGIPPLQQAQGRDFKKAKSPAPMVPVD
jgi:hypothetical protein